MLTQIQKLKIDGIELPFMHSYEFSINALTYKKSPIRSGTGAISNINEISTFYVPRLFVEFNYLTLKNYQFLLRLINKPEFTIEYFDWEKDNYVAQKFYLEPKERERINAFGGIFYGVVNYVLNFTGTLNEVGKYFTITYDLNGGSGLIPRQSVIYGQTIRLSSGVDVYRYGYYLDSWNTSADGSGTSYSLYQPIVVFDNLHLYAQWQVQTNFVLSFDYQGATTIPQDIDGNKITSKTVVYGQPIGELPIPQKTDHTFGGWWTLSGGQGQQFTSSTIFNIKLNTTIYAYWIKDT